MASFTLAILSFAIVAYSILGLRGFVGEIAAERVKDPTGWVIKNRFTGAIIRPATQTDMDIKVVRDVGLITVIVIATLVVVSAGFCVYLFSMVSNGVTFLKTSIRLRADPLSSVPKLKVLSNTRKSWGAKTIIASLLCFIQSAVCFNTNAVDAGAGFIFLGVVFLVTSIPLIAGGVQSPNIGKV